MQEHAIAAAAVGRCRRLSNEVAESNGCRAALAIQWHEHDCIPRIHRPPHPTPAPLGLRRPERETDSE
jgi:hypothetical protein